MKIFYGALLRSLVRDGQAPLSSVFRFLKGLILRSSFESAPLAPGPRCVVGAMPRFCRTKKGKL